jgi:hypothetical protein
MEELHYGELVAWLESFDFEPGVLTQSLSEPVNAFRAGLLRAAELLVLPCRIAMSASIWQLRHDAATHRIFGNLDGIRAGNASKRFKKIQEESADPSKGFNERDFIQWETGMSELAFGAKCVETAITFAELNVRYGSRVMFEVALVTAWTAFESLAADLWIAALNARPILGFIAIGAEPLPGDDENERERKRKSKLQIPTWIIREPEFTVDRNMGRILEAMNKWDFARRDQAKDAYAIVFHEHKARITKIFDDKALRWLTAARNMIVHNAGNADKEFLKLVKDHSQLSSAKIGEWVPIDARTVRDLFTASFKQGQELIDFVDDWMKNNPV